jgi:hypothetical protein
MLSFHHFSGVLLFQFSISQSLDSVTSRPAWRDEFYGHRRTICAEFSEHFRLSRVMPRQDFATANVHQIQLIPAQLHRPAHEVQSKIRRQFFYARILVARSFRAWRKPGAV